ncbi:MAG TPA: copper chaperone PCu(A)C, partial [Burkholderiales bacterium]|nr:copper chaperone PCu(A)C [Burkholderiales bacterium]
MKSLIGLVLFICSGFACAQGIEVTHAWVAATAPGQQVGGAYMDISSSSDVRLVNAESPVAKKVMIHAMIMKNGVMEMRHRKFLEIPAGKKVSLSPGKMHLMLMDIKKPLAEGDVVPIRLDFETKDGKTSV